MRKMIVPLMIMYGILMAQPTDAQRHHPNSKESIAYMQNTFLFGTRAVDTLVIKVMTANMPQHFNAPNMPQFTLAGKNRKYFMSIGGYLKMTVGYDWENPINSPYSFIPSMMPWNTPAGRHGKLWYGLGTSNISFNFVAFPESRYKLGTFIDIIFDQANYGARLYYAYIRWGGFTLGYTTSLFTDAASAPPTIDFQGPSIMPFYRNAVIDYEYQWGKHWGLGIGAEMPVLNYAGLYNTSIINQKVPDIPVYLQFSWNERSSWIRVSGLFRNMLYNDDVTKTIQNNFGWGVQLSGSVVFIPQLTLFYDGIFGRGISNYINDLNDLEMDMLPTHNKYGHFTNLQVTGGYLGLQYNFIPSAFISSTYSIVRTMGNGGTYLSDQYKNGQYLAANVFWSVNAHIQLGAEFLWCQVQRANSKRLVDKRLHCMVKLNF